MQASPLVALGLMLLGAHASPMALSPLMPTITSSVGRKGTCFRTIGLPCTPPRQSGHWMGGGRMLLSLNKRSPPLPPTPPPACSRCRCDVAAWAEPVVSHQNDISGCDFKWQSAGSSCRTSCCYRRRSRGQQRRLATPLVVFQSQCSTD